MSQVLGTIPIADDPRVLVDFRHSDDAGVFALAQNTALVQTVDFFTPIVDDPYQFGQIAAANALSDVYAMGGKPLTALAIACFPEPNPDTIGPEVIRAVFRGGLDKLAEAGVALLGGHTVQDAEIKFGYAVTGVVDPARVWSNAAARPGDLIVLTKPIGTGVATTAVKKKSAPEDLITEVTRSMQALNKAAAEALISLDARVSACTDVTGFGLLGHASEVALASGVTIEIVAGDVPLFSGIREHVAGNRTGGMAANRRHFGSSVAVPESIPPDLVDLFYDPQTSGGLLVFLAADVAQRAMTALAAAGVPAHIIGRVREKSGELISLT